MTAEDFRKFSSKWGDTARFLAGSTAVVLALYGFIGPRLAHKRGPVIVFSPDLSTVESGGEVGETILYKSVFHKYRDDCPIAQQGFVLTDARGITHALTNTSASVPSPLTPKDKAWDSRIYSFPLESSMGVWIGAGQISGSIIYNCPEGNVTVNYPSTPILITRRPF